MINKNKISISIRIEKELLDKVDERIRSNQFGNRGHAVNFALKRLFDFDKRELL